MPKPVLHRRHALIGSGGYSTVARLRLIGGFIGRWGDDEIYVWVVFSHAFERWHHCGIVAVLVRCEDDDSVPEPRERRDDAVGEAAVRAVERVRASRE